MAGGLITTSCSYCGSSLSRRPCRPLDGAKIKHFFCDNSCKGSWQREQKPWDAAWLHQKYIDEGLSANDIAKIVCRDAKRVWEWLRDYGIETRPRGHVESLLFKKGGASQFRERTHSVATKEKLRALRIADGRFPKQEDGRPFWSGKGGPMHPSWSGGSSPKRQAFYGSEEWKVARKAAYSAAKGRCERCGDAANLHVHHVMPFAFKHLRALPRNLRIPA